MQIILLIKRAFYLKLLYLRTNIHIAINIFSTHLNVDNCRNCLSFLLAYHLR